MNQAPANKDAPFDRAQLEERLATIEYKLNRVIEFDQTVTMALTHVLDRLKALEPMTAWAAQTDWRLENFFSVDALSRGSKIFPKTRSVVFVSKGYFGDNVKYAYLAFCEYARDKNMTVRFMAENEAQYDLLKAHGLPCMPIMPDKWTVDDIRMLFGAKVAVINDNFHPYAKRSSKTYGMLQGAKFVQLWHGIPMKDVGMRYVLRADNVLIEDLVASCGPYDVFVAPGTPARDEWAQMFSFREFASLGYPRNDIFFRDPGVRDLLNVDMETYNLFAGAQRSGKPTVLYTPTYRDDPASGWFDKAGITLIADHARMKGYAFAVNLHPLEQRSVEEFRKTYPGIHFVSPDMDIYPVVKHADMLITDYSSLAFDYLLLDRPLIFYRPDHEYYLKRSRGFIEGRLEMTPGAVTDNTVDLIRAIDAAAGFIRTPARDPFRTARQELRRKLFDHIDGNAGQRVCEMIMKLVESD